MNNIPLGLYIHFPWCVVKCPYCDFNSHPVQESLPESAYVDALIQDLQEDAAFAGDRQISSVFMGGGTPSLFSPESIGRVLAAADKLIGLTSDVEVTMEANPGAVEHAAFSGYLAAGVNRLSLGVQSFNDVSLKRLGRVHDSAAALAAFAEARQAGFTNINLDLMYGLPAQSPEEARDDVQRAIALAPEHISYYHLTMEPGTNFGRRPPADLPDDETAWAIFENGGALLEGSGYRRYEVSAYARNGSGNMRCKHNLNYWRYGDYLGIGAGAHGKVSETGSGTLRDDGHIFRTVRATKPARFIQAPGSEGRNMSEVEPEERLFEFMLNNLRLCDGFSLSDFEHSTGLDRQNLLPGLQAAARKGLLEERAPDCWQPTALGLRFLDDLQGLFLPGENPLR